MATQPKGLYTGIDPEGKRLSRSIIQKILIARAIVHQPDLLLMEDPMQFVEESEKNSIIDHIMHPDRGWTVIVVADYPYWEEKSTKVITLNKIRE
ncbi:MAG: hypothetical protein IPJ40_21225 [Saprospirales bacterium]|nr:hypothetical protein [Saprospirales bacterium]